MTRLKFNKREFELMLTKTDIIVAILLFLSLNINSIVEMSRLGKYYTRLSLVIFLGIGCVCLIKKHKFSPAFWLIILYWSIFMISTIINNTDNFEAGLYAIMPCLSVAMISEYFMKRRPKAFISAVLKFLLLLLFIDLISIIVFPGGMYKTSLQTANWFLGYKTERVRSVIMPVILFSGLNDIYHNDQISLATWIVSGIAIIDTYLSGATGGLVAILSLCLMMAVLSMSEAMKLRKYVFRLMNFKFLILTIILLNVVVVIFQNLTLFESFITNVLGKEMTLTGRTIIWANSWLYALESPIIGHGFITSTAYEKISGVLAGASPHNLLLGVFVYTGVIGIFVFLIMILFATSCTNKNQLKCSTLCMVYVVATLIMGISSFNLYGQFNYAVIICLYYFSIYEKMMY